MSIELISIGNEVLAGYTLNSNAAYIGQQLLSEGYRVLRNTVLPDSTNLLRQGISEAIHRSRLVIATGGLGPTCDDLTREIAAELFDSDFQYSKELADELKKRYGNFPTLDNQALIPSKAIILKNAYGTASGLIFNASFNSKPTTLILLPGVPAEMKGMLPQVLDYIKSNRLIPTKHYSKQIHFHGLSEAAVDPLLRQLIKQYPAVEFGIYPSQGLLSVLLMLESGNEALALAQLEEPYRTITSQFSANVFETTSGKLEEAVHKLFVNAGITLCAAESCTGGTFSSRLTALAGSSQYFMGSIVAYSNELKIRLLGVSEQLIQEKGAVSEEVVKEMLSGIMKVTNCDYGVAVTGIAGPTGGTSEKPIGTVWCAVGKKGEVPYAWKLQAHGNREMVIDRSVNALLSELLKKTRGAIS